MNLNRPDIGQDLTIPLPARSHAIAWLLISLAVLILMNIVLIIADGPLSLAVLPVLFLIGVCKALLIFVTTQQVMGRELVLNQQGITLKQLFGSETYAWTDIDSVELTPATGTLSDNPLRKTSDRVGIGLNLRGPLSPDEKVAGVDVIITAGDAERVAHLMQLKEKIDAYQMRIRTPSARRRAPKRARQANQRNQFRAAGDLVA